MKSMFRVKAFVVALLSVAGIFFLVSCDRFGGGTLSGNMKFTYRISPVLTTGNPEFQTKVLSGREVILLQYNDTLIQKDKELREECSPKITTAYKRCQDEELELLKRVELINMRYSCDEGKTIIQNCVNNRNNIALSYTVQKVTTDANGDFLFPNKIPYGKYILFATFGVNWWLVPIIVNQPQLNMDLTEKNAFIL